MKKVISYNLLILSLVIVKLPIYAIANDGFEFEKGAEIKVTYKGADKKGVFCEFHTSKEDLQDQIKHFFTNSKQISPSEMDKIFLQPPCLIKGIIIDRNGTHQWEIRGFTTGAIKLQNGRELYFLRDTKCEQ
jgi:hypothetical protein